MLPRFITQMDKQAARAIAVVIVMFLVVAMIAVVGKSALQLEDGQNYRWFETFKESTWVGPIVVATFIAGSFIGVPQWALIAGMVIAFGLTTGGIGAWGSTMISASLNFWLARWIGAERLQQFGGDFINRIAGVVRRNGFVTSFAIRLVPTGPFILVNMAAGVSKMKFPHFLAGTGLGIIPKIVVTGLITMGVVSDEQNDWIKVGMVGLAFVFIAIMLLARKRLQKFVEPK